MTATILSTGSDWRAGLTVAAALAAEAAPLTGGSTLLVELGDPARERKPTLLAAPAAREIESRVRDSGLQAAARGQACHLALAGEEVLPRAAQAMEAARADLAVVHLPGRLWVPALETAAIKPCGACVWVGLPADRPLAALACDELGRRDLPVQIATQRPAALATHRAMAGARAGGALSALAARILRRLLGADPAAAQRGQALPALLGAGVILVLTALVLAAIGGAVTGRGRVQRAADVAAVSAVRSMRDDVPRLLAPERLEDGRPNPRHISLATYLGRARLAAVDAARRNGVGSDRVELSFPSGSGFPPLQARVEVKGRIDPGRLPGGDRSGERTPIPVAASAVAEASPPGGGWSGMPEQASGGGYSGPLVYRDGEGMRPDVGAAFDRMAVAARREGLDLVVVSGFRSDAEQARLFAQNPDPRWVAPPGRSLHRCATELDLGPSGAYGWLAANGRRFGFLQRYGWEAWHYGLAAGPPPCSDAGNAATGDGAGSLGSNSGLPGFVPAAFREPLLRSAARWSVSPGLLAAQLMAESGFNPRAVSPAGAQGIAQFMPATARSYGLRDPFDPVAAIDAQARLMSDLLRQFRSVPLALAAYNAGSGAVAACRCVPGYPETRAYVARILALANGAGVLFSPPLEVRLIQ